MESFSVMFVGMKISDMLVVILSFSLDVCLIIYVNGIGIGDVLIVLMMDLFFKKFLGKVFNEDV